MKKILIVCYTALALAFAAPLFLRGAPEENAAAPAAAPAPAAGADNAADVDSAVRSIEESVSKIQPEPPVDIDLSASMKAPSKPKKSIDRTQTFNL